MEEKENGLSPKTKRVMLSSAAILLLLGGTGTYYWQASQTTETASNSTSKKPDEKGKASKDITLNTDDNQVDDDREDQDKKDGAITPDMNGEGFSLNGDGDDPVYLVDASNSNDPITKLKVDDDTFIPIPIPKEPEFQQPNIPEIDPTPGDEIGPGETETEPGDGTVPPGDDNQNPDDGTNPGDNPGGGNGGDDDGNNGGGTNPGDEDPGSQFPDVAVVVPESLYERLNSYSNDQEFYNVMYYGKKEITSENDTNGQLMELVVQAAAEAQARAELDQMMTEESMANIQLLTSLGFENQQLKDLQNEIKTELFSKFAEQEVSIYLTKPADSENPAEELDPEKAQQVLYYIGKYNDQNDRDLNPNEYSDADRIVMEAAQQEQATNIAAALNKYQMLAQYSPTFSEDAMKLKAGIVANKVEQVRSEFGPRQPGQYEPLPEGKELETLQNLLEQKKYAQVVEQGGELANSDYPLPFGQYKKVVKEASEGLLAETNALASGLEAFGSNKETIIRNYQVLTEETGVPEKVNEEAASHLNAFFLMVQADKAEDLSEAVILASESMDAWEGNQAFQSKVDSISSELLASAEQYGLADMKKEESIYELLSTTPRVSDTVKATAFDRKKSFAYSRKATDLLGGKNYYEAIFYASQSNQIYNKGQNTDTLRDAARSLFAKNTTGNYEDQFNNLLIVYRMIATATGMPANEAAMAIGRQEAIDHFQKGMREKSAGDREKAVYYFDRAADSDWMADKVDGELQDQAKLLLNDANYLKSTGSEDDKKLAVRYYKTLLITKHVSIATREEAKSAINELKKNSAPAAAPQKEEVPQQKQLKRSEPQREKPQTDNNVEKEAPKVEKPAVDAPKEETPKETPKEEAPQNEAPQSEPQPEETTATPIQV